MTVRDIVILGCSSQQPTRFRNHGAYLVRWNDEGLLFDPGEGTQRQFIFANVAPTVISRIFISHFHGDHCLGLGSILMRLNLDQVSHPIHCYYPASGKKYFDRLRYGTIYHDMVNVIEHPVKAPGVVHEDEHFRIEAAYLEHGVENLGWRITEPDTRKFEPNKLEAYGIRGPMVRELHEKGFLTVQGKNVTLDDVSWVRHGDTLAVVIDTRFCQNALDLARNAKVMICESTYMEEHQNLAHDHYHLTSKQAALIAKNANVKKLILTHFSARYVNLREMEAEAKSIFPNTYMAEDLKIFPFER
jgi:ribonuclease Z